MKNIKSLLSGCASLVLVACGDSSSSNSSDKSKSRSMPFSVFNSPEVSEISSSSGVQSKLTQIEDLWEEGKNNYLGYYEKDGEVIVTGLPAFGLHSPDFRKMQGVNLKKVLGSEGVYSSEGLMAIIEGQIQRGMQISSSQISEFLMQINITKGDIKSILDPLFENDNAMILYGRLYIGEHRLRNPELIKTVVGLGSGRQDLMSLLQNPDKIIGLLTALKQDYALAPTEEDRALVAEYKKLAGSEIVAASNSLGGDISYSQGISYKTVRTTEVGGKVSVNGNETAVLLPIFVTSEQLSENTTLASFVMKNGSTYLGGSYVGNTDKNNRLESEMMIGKTFGVGFAEVKSGFSREFGAIQGYVSGSVGFDTKYISPSLRFHNVNSKMFTGLGVDSEIAKIATGESSIDVKMNSHLLTSTSDTKCGVGVSINSQFSKSSSLQASVNSAHGAMFTIEYEK